MTCFGGGARLTNDQHIWLAVNKVLFIPPSIKPVLPPGRSAVLDTLRPIRPNGFLMSIELVQSRVDNPDLPLSIDLHQTNHTSSGTLLGSKGNKEADSLGPATRCEWGQLGFPEIRRRVKLYFGETAWLVLLEILQDVVAAFDGAEGPRDCEVVAPVAVFGEESAEGFEVLGGESLVDGVGYGGRRGCCIGCAVGCSRWPRLGLDVEGAWFEPLA